MELDDDALASLEHRGRYVVPEEVVALTEGHHDGPGIERERLRGYADVLSEEFGGEFDSEVFGRGIEERLTDAETWGETDADARGEAVFDLGENRVSRYPSRWHEALGDTTDIRDYLRFIEDEDPAFRETVGSSGAGEGVDQAALLSAVAAVSDSSHAEARQQLEELRRADEVVEDADEHPDAGVYLADRVSDVKDPDL